MKINSADFIISAVKRTDYPKKRLNEIAFAGRSNVGKSSIINNLLTRKALAKVSKTPGKTRTLNYFLINKKFHFVDLPGYGFARVSKEEQTKWEIMIEEYLTENQHLKQLIILADIRHPLQNLDLEMILWAEQCKQPYTVVLTKADQIKPNEVEKQRVEMHKALKKNQIEIPLEKIIPYSINSGKFKSSLWTELNKHLR